MDKIVESLSSSISENEPSPSQEDLRILRHLYEETKSLLVLYGGRSPNIPPQHPDDEYIDHGRLREQCCQLILNCSDIFPEGYTAPLLDIFPKIESQPFEVIKTLLDFFNKNFGSIMPENLFTQFDRFNPFTTMIAVGQGPTHMDIGEEEEEDEVPPPTKQAKKFSDYTLSRGSKRP